MADTINSEITQKYQGNDFSFPLDDVDPKKKLEPEYARKALESMFSYYVNDSTSIGYSRRFDFQLYRLYGDGRQPTGKYMDILCPQEEGDTERKGYMNISWDIFSVAPKFRSLVMGIFEKVDHDISIDAIDEMSGGMKEELKFSLWAENQLAPFKQEMNEIIGEEVMMVEDKFMPETLEEMEIYAEAGGFKLNSEISMEKALKLSFYLSRWSEIKTKLLEDAFDLGVIAVKDYIDIQTQKPRTRYVDPAYIIADYSRDKTFRGGKYKGELVEYTIDNYVAENQHLTKAELNRNLEQIYMAYNNAAINPDYGFDFDYYNLYYRNKARDFVFYVVDAEWFSTDTIVRSKRTRSDGKERVYKEDYSKRFMKDSEKRKYKKTKLKNVYRGKWVVGTDVVWDHGQQFDIPRPNSKQKKREPQLSYHMYKLANRSICASIIPHLDSIQLAWLRMQNVIATAAPPGVAIEIDKLLDISLTGNAGETLQPIDILKIRQDTGNLIYSSEDATGKFRGQQGKPIQELQGGFLGQVQEQMNYIIQEIEIIREITGLSRAVDASSPQPDVAVGTSKIAMGATDNILQGIQTAYTNLKEETGKNLSLRWQLAARYNKQGFRDAIPSLGKTSMEIIKIGSEVSFPEYGLQLILKPTEEQKNKIEEAAAGSMLARREGGIGIKLSDYVQLIRLLEAGQVKFAGIYLAHKEEKYQKEASRAQAENEKANTERAIEVQNQKAQADEGAAQTEHQRKKELIDQEKKWQIEIDNNKSRNTINEMSITAGKDVDKALIASETSVETQQMKSDTEITKEVMRGQNTDTNKDSK